MNQSQIQAKYVKSKNLCRLEAGRLLAGSDTLANSADAQAAVNNSFTECMTKAGWRSPKPQQVAQTSNPPSTNPSAAAARQRPVENPPSGAPSTQPSAATATQAPVAKPAPKQAEPVAQPQPASTLNSRTSSAGFAFPGQQPARPPSVPAAPYGSSARKF